MKCDNCGSKGSDQEEVHVTAIGKRHVPLCDSCRKMLLPSFAYGEREPPERAGETIDHYPPEGRIRDPEHMVSAFAPVFIDERTYENAWRATMRARERTLVSYETMKQKIPRKAPSYLSRWPTKKAP